MPKKKSEENPLKQAEKAVKKVAKQVKEEAEKIAEVVSDEAKELTKTLKHSVEMNLAENVKSETKKIVKKESEKDEKKSKLEALKEKAKQLEKKVSEEPVTLDIKQKMKSGEEKGDTLVPIEDYLKSSIHLGTRVITPDMRPFVYKRRADGLAVFNTSLLDKKIREAADFLAQYAPEDVIVVCKREAGWEALELFSKSTGITFFTKKYPAGILTNPHLDIFREANLVVIGDPWIDKNALEDAQRTKVPILAVCDTNNYTRGVTQILPGNNKSAKSLGMIFYLLAKNYVDKRKIKTGVPPISEWIENWESLTPPK